MTVAAQSDVCAVVIDAGVAVTLTLVTVAGDDCELIGRMIFTNFEESCTDVAVTVSVPEEGVLVGAVYRPVLPIVPETALHFTPVLKAPVPETTAVHWLFWPVCTPFGEHVPFTAETLDDCPRFSIEPVQPAKERIAKKRSMNAAFRVFNALALSST